MTVLAAISLVSFITLIVLSALVFVRNPKSATNKSCAVMLGLYAIVTFIEFGYRHAHTEEQARFWWSIDVVWPISLIALFYFALFFTKRNAWLKRPAVHFAILAPAFSAVFIECFTDLITGPPTLHSWGWGYTSPDTIISKVFFIWFVVVVVFGFTLLLRYRSHAPDKRRKKQATLISVVWLIGVGSSVFEGLIMPESGDLPSMLGAYWMVGGCLTAYAMWRYDVFALSPISAAENIVAAMADSLLLINSQFKVESANAAAQYLLEYDEKQLRSLPVIALFDPSSPLPGWLSGENSEDTEVSIKYIDARFRTKNGRRVPIWLASAPLYDVDGIKLGYMMIGRDITERNRREQELHVFKNHLEKLVEKRTAQLERSLDELKRESDERERAERDRETLEVEKTALKAQLYHAQKLESIGRLAGGVAHDFNNLLFVINTYSEGFLQNLKPEDPKYADFQEIYQAARRATALTQQLLAFSRKQIAAPKIIDINEAIHQLQRMLVRLIGEHIHINIIPGINLGRVRIDPGQFDQILMNLAVNARDAMSSGGAILIETNQTVLTGQQTQDNETLLPGTYVVIRFSDTGHGMNDATKAQIFDPFFSTKAPGKGTGLGLSTIYGIVKQNGGFVEVDSRVGEGTTFKLYFPKHEVDTEIVDAATIAQGVTGNETILLVEDDDQVRKLASRLLRQLGYRVIEAGGAGEAAGIFFESRTDIDLLFTDVVMPGMNGKQLSKLLGTTKPKLKVLFMSGYNEEITDRLGKLDKSTNFIAKPFSSGDLSQKVRQVLDA